MRAAAGALPPAGLAPLLMRSLSSVRLPYPALHLKHTTWIAVDLNYTLPGIPAEFEDEVLGALHRN